jgi:hypothetical protein
MLEISSKIVITSVFVNFRTLNNSSPPAKPSFPIERRNSKEEYVERIEVLKKKL